MKRIFIASLVLYFSLGLTSGQSPISELPWRQVATGMPAEWYGSDESVKVAENVLLYQREVGGWPKNTAFHLPLDDSARQKVLSEKKNSDAIFDNNATTSEMRFLAFMYDKRHDRRYHQAFNIGLKFILNAQYDNGGWPMFYPLRKGYYTHITFNDNAIVNILTMLREIAERKTPFKEIVNEENYARTPDAWKKGIDLILKTQIRVNGKPTVWCAQYDEVTLLPAKARSYELPSFSGAESVGIVKLLMRIPDPTPAIISSVEGAMAWFDSHRIKNTRWEYFINDEGLKDRKLICDRAAGDIWARFYDLETQEPFVCDRDGIKKRSPAEIGYERRNGYSWFTDDPSDLFRVYPKWRKRWLN